MTSPEEKRRTAHHRLWNQLSTDEARRLYRPHNLWPKTSVSVKRKPLLVHTTPRGAMKGTHRS